MTDKVWESKLDDIYDVYVERLAPYKGLLVCKNGDATLLEKEVTITFDAIYGPDIADLQEWQDEVVKIIPEINGR